MWSRGVYVHRFISLWWSMPVRVFGADASRRNRPYRDEITHRKDLDTLRGIISAHATSTVLPGLLTNCPSSTFTLHQEDLDRNASRHVWPPSYPLSFPYLPPCWFICALSLSSHLSSLSISSYSSPGSARNRYGRTLALSSLYTPTGLCQQVSIGPPSAATSSTRVWCVGICVCVLDCQESVLSWFQFCFCSH